MGKKPTQHIKQRISVETKPLVLYNKTRSMSDQNYNADQIQVLEGLDPVRKRPGMYIGSTDQRGLHHLIQEIVNNSMDEAMAGHANHVKLEFFEDGSVACFDNGRGIPYGMKKEQGKSALELVHTVLHAGGKFGGGGYKVSSGLHGVGASVVNALSDWMRVVVRNGKEIVVQEYEKGGKPARQVEPLDPNKPVSKVKGVDWNLDVAGWDYETGTITQFKPDETIFETTNFNFKHFINLLREYAYLTANIRFDLVDHRNDESYSFYFEGGIKAYVKALNRNKKTIHDNVFYISKTIDEVEVEVALQYNDAFNDNVLCFANHIRNNEGGTHLTGFRTALTRVVNEYGRNNGLLKEKDPNLSSDDLKEGLTAVISVGLDNDVLQFEGQTKGKLGNSHVRTAVEKVTKEALEIFFEENPKDAQSIINKNVLALRARIAAKAARDTVIRKTAIDGGGVLPGKLADCAVKDPEKAELFIVEGDSAGGSAKQGRDRHTQAILPLFGKPLNTERARLDKVVDNEKLKHLIVALGTGIGELYNPEKLRYHKLVIMADADIDGFHIATLYLTFFYRHMPELIEGGHIYLASPPLFKATWGKNKEYITDEENLAKFRKTENGQKAIVQRFKGLGEMNEEELWETTMNPQTRTLKQVTIEDASMADEVFTVLMGSEVAPRKKFIMTHAKDAEVDVA